MFAQCTALSLYLSHWFLAHTGQRAQTCKKHINTRTHTHIMLDTFECFIILPLDRHKKKILCIALSSQWYEHVAFDRRAGINETWTSIGSHISNKNLRQSWIKKCKSTHTSIYTIIEFQFTYCRRHRQSFMCVFVKQVKIQPSSSRYHTASVVLFSSPFECKL